MASRLLGSFLPQILVLQLLLLCAPGALSVTFTLTNNCDRTVWPGLLSSAGISPLSTTGFALQKGESCSVDVPRTGPDACGSGQLECSGGGAAPPATLAEFKLAGADGKDFYDVSLVDGYNLPMLVQPQGGSTGDCTTTGCVVDLNGVCPYELVMASAGGDGGPDTAAACKSACEAFGKPKYCCNGEYGNPSTCRPTPYSQVFKNACHRVYSYAYDDGTSTFPCTATGTLLSHSVRRPRMRARRPRQRTPKRPRCPSSTAPWYAWAANS